jgi:hypothetical protein
MRLGQLSRKIAVRPGEIVDFLATKGIVIDENTNTRVPDDHAKMVMGHFAPGLAFEEVSPELTNEVVMSEPERPSEVHLETKVETADDLSSPEVSLVEESEVNAEEQVAQGEVTPSEATPEAIKAPKIELQGLKVLGKIELPQPKKKENSSEEVTQEIVNAETSLPENPETKLPRQERRPKNESRRSRQNDQHSSQRSRKNPIALQREREAREAEERRKEEIKKEKEKRTEYYMQRVKAAAPSKRITIVDEPLSQLHDEVPDEPKTLWGKFMKWLTSH